MLSDELQRNFFKHIPSEFEIEDETINFSKRYANQFVDADLPAIVLSYITTGMVNYIYLNEAFVSSRETTDYIEIEDNVYEYELEVLDPQEILKVEGYKNGSFVEIDKNDYELVIENSQGKIKFFELPDIGTTCQVYYKHKKIRAEYGGEFQDRVQIDVLTTNYEKDDGGMINGLQLNKKVVRELKKELRFGFESDNISVRRTTDTRNLTGVEGQDYHYRNTFDVMLAYHDTYTKYFDSIKEVNYELQKDVI